jgi:nucleotide-binding universal stress UspA family protein
MFKCILVPLDGSPFGEHALPLALSIARRSGAALRLVRVLPRLVDVFFWTPPPGDPMEVQLREQHLADAQAYMEDVGNRLADTADVAATYDVVEEGEEIGVTESLRAEAVATGADLVVMTTHGRGALERFWLGSVPDELVRSLTVPVLLLHPTQPHADLEADVPLRHIVLALDGTPFAEQIMQPALALGKAMGADYTLVRVIHHALAGGHPAAAAGAPAPSQAMSEMLAKIGERVRKDAEAYLEAVAESLRSDGARVQIRMPVASQPAPAILKEAAAGADLIALETHGRRGLSRLLLGGVADKVIRGSAVPVLVCRGS